MSGCVEHGVMTFGCEACNRALRGRAVDAETTAALMDKAYTQGFEDGAKWLAAGARAQLDAIVRSLAKGVRRTEVIAAGRAAAAARLAAQHKGPAGE